MKKVVLYCLLHISYYGWAQQNLVPNHSFEQNTGCYHGGGGVNYVVTFWKTYSYASVDYFHPCNNNQNTPYVGVPYNIFGFQNSQEGIAYAGIYTFNRSSSSFRDYLVVELTDTIIKGIPYLITFYISPADKVKYGIYHVGAYLSAEPR